MTYLEPKGLESSPVLHLISILKLDERQGVFCDIFYRTKCIAGRAGGQACGCQVPFLRSTNVAGIN